ncbi:unnamed protein product [Lactuca saligna]|uniref:RNA helicase n=1 Tax=Lactuca saligna TaxID=75948 RepID=A0AA35VIT3_LACSI|nr:unnamed protein product [Lactuca saligna]
MDPKRKSKVSLFDVVDEATFTTKLNIDDGRTTAHGVYISNMSVVNRWNGRPYSQRYYDMLEKRTILPVWHKKREFLKAFKDNQVLIIAGESGSGKTTQIPQFVLETIDVESPYNHKRFMSVTVFLLTTGSVIKLFRSI